jgi:hypothetical protein
MFNYKLKTKELNEDVSLKNLPTMRQAFVVASLIVGVSVLFSQVIHPDWIYMALLPAAGLLFSGLSGFCPLIFVLQLLPYNKKE